MGSPYGAGAIATPASNTVYGVGADIFHWDGATWAIQDSLSNHLYPSLVATTVLPDGEIWAAGRDIDADGIFYDLVYRSNTGSVGTTEATNHQGDIQVHPNPFTQVLNVQLKVNENGTATATLTDCLGRIMLTQQTAIRAGENRFTIEAVEPLPAGIYFLDVRTHQGFHRLKVVRQ